MTLSELQISIKEHRLIISAIAFLVVVFIVLMLVTHYHGAGTGLAKYSPVAEIMTALILLLTLISIYRQIGHIQEQNDLQRAVASKSAIQELNKVLLDEKEIDFLSFVFLKEEGENEEGRKAEIKKARQAMMAFSLMNSLEMRYLTRDEKVKREDFKRLLHGFTKNVRGHWKDSFPTVYRPEFQKIVTEVFDEMEKEESSGAEAG